MSHSTDEDLYAAKANRIAVYNPLGDVVAIVELVSPGNKNSRHAIRSFVEKTIDLLRKGVNILIVDPFPPSKRDTQGIHKVIWDEIREEPFEIPPDKQLTLVAYSAGVPMKAYVESVFCDRRVARPEPIADRRIICPLPCSLVCAPRQLAPAEDSP
jgi:hypothetical protein